MAQLARYDQAGATVYSVSALYEAYSSDDTLYAFSPRTVNNPD